METVKLTIDNKHLEVPKGTTILQAAKQAGINIPSLCYMNLPHLDQEHKPGSCRVCVVEIPGRKTLVPACVTKCTDGMEVLSHSLRAINAAGPWWNCCFQTTRKIASYVLLPGIANCRNYP